MSNNGISEEDKKLMAEVESELDEFDPDKIDQELDKEESDKEKSILDRLTELAEEKQTTIDRIWYVELVCPIKREGKTLKTIFFKRPNRKDLRLFQGISKKSSPQKAEELWTQSMSYDELTTNELDHMDAEDYSKIVKKLMSFSGITLQDILQQN